MSKSDNEGYSLNASNGGTVPEATNAVVGTSQQLLGNFTLLNWLLTSEPVLEVAGVPASRVAYNRFGAGQVEGASASNFNSGL